MILISHRGNTNGKFEYLENKPTYIDTAINQGFDVEVDVWCKNGDLFLGHDKPDYGIQETWFKDRINKLWIHCKNIEAIEWFDNSKDNYNYFWHEEDKLTLTSHKYIWVYPGNQPIKNSIAVMPEIYNEDVSMSYGVCSDFVEKYRKPILKVTHNAGFFSCCTIRLMEIINFHCKNGILPVVDSSQQWESYKDSNLDITEQLFKNKIKIDDFEPSFMINSDYENQFSNYDLINYDYVNKLVERYFTPSNEIISLISDLIKKYNINLDKTITVCYRGNDKFRETILPTYEEMLLKIEEVLILNPTYNILLQTDEIEFQEIVKNKFSNVFTIDETKKINKSNTAVQYTIRLGERLNNAKIFLAVMCIMSKTSKIILNSGNVGMWLCLFRGSTKGVYQYLNHMNTNDVKKWLK